MRLIDADKMNLLLGICDRDIYAKRILDRMETIDAVPVVRCKDCGYYEIGEDNLPYCRHPDGGISDYPQPDDFCSYGKRKWRDDKKDFAALKNANSDENMRDDEHEISGYDFGCIFYANRKCNLDGYFCPEGPGCPYECHPSDSDRIRELMQAEKDGRIVLLPYKRGL